MVEMATCYGRLANTVDAAQLYMSRFKGSFLTIAYIVLPFIALICVFSVGRKKNDS